MVPRRPISDDREFSVDLEEWDNRPSETELAHVRRVIEDWHKVAILFQQWDEVHKKACLGIADYYKDPELTVLADEELEELIHEEWQAVGRDERAPDDERVWHLEHERQRRSYIRWVFHTAAVRNELVHTLKSKKGPGKLASQIELSESGHGALYRSKRAVGDSLLAARESIVGWIESRQGSEEEKELWTYRVRELVRMAALVFPQDDPIGQLDKDEIQERLRLAVSDPTISGELDEVDATRPGRRALSELILARVLECDGKLATLRKLIYTPGVSGPAFGEQ